MMDLIDKIIQFEGGEMSDEDAVEFFQELIDTGLAWSLQGFYGQTARDLIDAGLCIPNRVYDEVPCDR